MMSSLTAPRHGFGAFILLTLVIIFLVSATHTQLSHQLDSRDIPTANNESSLTKDDGLYVRGIPTANNESSLTKNDGLYVRDVSAAPDESSLINNDGIVTAQPVQQSSIRFGSAHFQISNLFRSIRIKRDTTTLYSARYVGQQGVDRMNAIGLTKHGSTDLDDLENDGWTVSNGASSHFPPGLEAPLRHLIPGLAGGGSTQTLRNDKAYTDVNGKKRVSHSSDMVSSTGRTAIAYQAGSDFLFLGSLISLFENLSYVTAYYYDSYTLWRRS